MTGIQKAAPTDASQVDADLAAWIKQAFEGSS